MLKIIEPHQTWHLFENIHASRVLKFVLFDVQHGELLAAGQFDNVLNRLQAVV